MLLKIFGFTFDKLVGKVSKKKQAAARALFMEILLILAEGAAAGAVKGAKSR